MAKGYYVVGAIAAIILSFGFYQTYNFHKFLKENNCMLGGDAGKDVYLADPSGSLSEHSPKFQRMYGCTRNGTRFLVLEP